MSSQFQSLSNTFNLLLTEYTNTYKKYIDVINSNDNSLTTVNDTLFADASNINVINNSNVNSCLASCSSNSSCAGATFNGSNQSCSLSSGNGRIVYTKNSTAIVKKAISYSYKLQQLNNQMTDINKQMINISKSNYNEYEKNKQTSNQQEQTLKNNYETLIHERNEIKEMINNYETINAAYENGSVNVTSNYYKYIVLLFVVIFLVIFLLKYSFKNTMEQLGGGKYFNWNTTLYLIFLGIVVVFNASIKK